MAEVSLVLDMIRIVMFILAVSCTICPIGEALLKSAKSPLPNGLPILDYPHRKHT